MRALVAGGTGFLGGAIARALAARGWDVVCLSRAGGAPAGAGVAGDVRAADLGIAADAARDLRASVTHVVSCFGSVQWSAAPRHAVELHLQGTRNLLSFARSCPGLERFVHVSSVLALGRARGVVGNRELDVGQGFRNWYEFAKHVAERAVRDDDSVPRRVVRFGPVLGVSAGAAPGARDGILAALPHLLRGYPVHLRHGGAFPCYAGEVGVAAEVVARAAAEPGDGGTWTWFDDRMPTLAEVLTELCAPWRVVPRIVDVPALGRATSAFARRTGAPPELVAYAEPWFALDPAVLDALPPGLPACPDGYVQATGAALAAHPAALARTP